MHFMQVANIILERYFMVQNSIGFWLFQQYYDYDLSNGKCQTKIKWSF